MTLSQWEALESRRAVEIRHARFNVGIVASILFNAKRDPEADAVSPFDFVPGMARTEEELEEERRIDSLKKSVRIIYQRIGFQPEKVKRTRARILKQLRAANVPDADEFIAEVFDRGGHQH